MGQRYEANMQRLRAARSRLRTRALPALVTALLLQISIATARPSYDLRALSSAFGLILLIALALLAATVDALATFAVSMAREAARTRVRFGPAVPIAVTPRPIGDDLLLDKRGRPLRGAARVARIAAIERERAAIAAIAAAPTGRVIELPALRDLRAHPAVRYLVSLPVPRVRFPALPLRWVRIVAITTTMTFVFATAIGTSGIISQQGTVALGASTTLTIISGDVSVRASDADEFRPAADGVLLRAGMTIRTGADTYAVLTYFEGSTVSLDPGTTLVIEALEANPDGSTVIAMRQEIGRTWHAVAKLLRQGSKYEVRTPTATATVRGTMFAVGVERDEQGEIVSTVETTEGAVGTAKAATPAEPQPQEVVVQPGFQVQVKQTAPLEPPKPAPEPERKVTVTVGAAGGLVVDPVGRANGIKDGKLVVQTPGATVQTVDGKLVVILPKIPDGKIATVVDPKVAPRGPVQVVTTVSERGRSEQRSEDRVEPATGAAPALVAVEVKKAAPIEIAKVTDAQKKDIASGVKVAEAPKPPAVEERKPDETKDKERKDERREGPGAPGGGGPTAPGGFLPAITIPPLPAPAIDPSGATLVGKRTEPAKEPAKENTETAPRPPEQSSGPASAPSREQPKQAPPKAEALSGFVPRFDLPGTPAAKPEAAKAEAPRNEQPKADAPKVEAPGGFVPRLELPLAGPKADAPKNDAPRAEQPKNDAPKSEPAKDAPKVEAPKQEQPKQEPAKERSQPQPQAETSHFVPTLTLPPLPFAPESAAQKKEQPAQAPGDGASPKKDEPAKTEAPKIDLPKIELPKIELPFFQQPSKTLEPERQEGGKDKEKDDKKTPEPPKRGEIQRDEDRSIAVGRSATTAVSRGSGR